MNKLMNKKGFTDPFSLMLIGLILATGYGAYQYSQGEWGRYGSENVQARQAEIIAKGGHINQAPNQPKSVFNY